MRTAVLVCLLRSNALGVGGLSLSAAGSCRPGKGSNRRLEFELGAWFEGSCGFAFVLALSQMREHGLGPFGRADLHPRRNPLDRQGRFAPQPGGNNLKKSPVDLQPLTTIQ